MLRSAISVFLGLLVLGGCAPRLVVSSLQPAAVNVGSIETVKLADGQGRRSAREFLVHEVARQMREGGYFRVIDASESGLRIELVGRSASIEGDELAPGEGVLRLDVYEWTGEIESRTQSYEDSKGNRRTRRVDVGVARVALGATLVDADGRAVLAEREYETTAEIGTNDRNVAIETAASRLVREILLDLTPQLVRRRVRLDDSNKDLEPIIKTAKDGNLPQAAEDLRAYLRDNPNDAAARFNLAVFLDALGQYHEALAMYDEAIRVSGDPPSYYSDARSQCATRLADAEALSR
ncbi:MAG: tetratricopeptide repeat protein [Myxococcota bacterium]